MLRLLTPVLTLVLLSLASGLVPVPKASLAPTPVKTFRDSAEFKEFGYELGSFSYVLVEALSGAEMPLEGRSQEWSCRISFANPSDNYVEWIHPVELSCDRGAETLIFPLGEGEFRKAYTRGRVLLKGVAAESLAEILQKSADDKSVESPISERVIAWGPKKLMRILTLRRSDKIGKLQFSLECYEDAETGDLHSCALLY